MAGSIKFYDNKKRAKIMNKKRLTVESLQRRNSLRHGVKYA